MHPSMYDHEQIRKELREQKRKANLNPLVPEKAPKVWVAYVWEGRRWILGGFVRMQRVTARRVDRWRKKMKVAKDAIVRWVELFTAARSPIETRKAYHYHPTLRPDSTPAMRKAERARKRRAKAPVEQPRSELAKQWAERRAPTLTPRTQVTR